jgi:outer membrane protein
MVAAFANIRSKEAKISQIKASYYPKISAVGSVGYGQDRLSLGGLGTFDQGAPTFGGGLAVEFPIFDGFFRHYELLAAESELGEANSQLQQSGDRTSREVWQAYTDLHTAISSESAAEALVKASGDAYDSVLSSYKRDQVDQCTERSLPKSIRHSYRGYCSSLSIRRFSKTWRH